MPSPRTTSRFAVLFLSVPTLTAGMVLPAAAAPPKKAAPPAPAPAGKVTVRGDVLYQQAAEAASKGDYDRAIQLCRAILKAEPNAAAVWGTLGQLLARQGMRAEGIAALKKAAALAPRAAAFWTDLGSMQFGAGRYADAVASARKAVALEPKNDGALATLASGLMALRQYKEALPVLRQLSAVRGGKDERVSQNMVFAQTQAGDRKGALETAQKVAAARPKDLNAQLGLADIATKAGNLPVTYTALQKARSLAPNDPRVALNLALAAEAIGKPSEGVAILEKLVVAQPKDHMAHFQLGRLYYLNEAEPAPRRFARAEKELRTATELDPKNAVYVAQLGLAQMFQGQAHFEGAQKSFQKALALDPKNATASMGIGYVAEQQQDWAKAIEGYRAAVKATPNNHFVRRRLAGVLIAANRRDEAYSEFWELASRNPKDTFYLKELGSYLLTDKRYGTARAAYETVLERAPTDVAAMIGIGQTYEAQNRKDLAEKQYETAIAAAPKRPDTYFMLGLLYAEQKKTDKAVEVFEKLLTLDPSNNGARWELSQIYQKAGKDDKALEHMRKLTLQAGDPNRINYRLGPASLLIERKRYAEAVTEIQKILHEEPNSEGLQYALADALTRAGRASEAESQLREMITKARPGEEARPKLALAQVFDDTDRPEEAAKVYEEVLATDALNPQARAGLVHAREVQKRPEAAAEYLETLATSNPDAPNMDAVNALESLHSEGKTPAPEKFRAFTTRLIEKYPKSREALAAAARAAGPGDREAAMALYRRVLEIDPKDADAHFQIGVQLELLGRKEEAIAAYRETLKIDPKSVGAENALKRLSGASGKPAAAQAAPSAPKPAGQKVPGGEQAGEQKP